MNEIAFSLLPNEFDKINRLRSKYHKTALGKGNGITAPTRYLFKWFDDHPEVRNTLTSVLDYGCGKGRDEDILRRNFTDNYVGYEPHKEFGFESNNKALFINILIKEGKLAW